MRKVLVIMGDLENLFTQFISEADARTKVFNMPYSDTIGITNKMQ